ncbi:MAG: flagellar biosynthetic protein FliO [Acidimicrobiales bacterium]
MPPFLAIRFVLGVGVVVVMLWFASRMARRMPARMGKPTSTMRVLERTPVAKGVTLVRVGLEDRDLLLSCSTRGAEVLCELDKRPDPPTPAPSIALLGDAQPFPKVLSEMLRGRRPR